MEGASKLAQAVQDWISKQTQPMSMEEVYEQYPPEQVGMSMGSGNLGPVAGIFKSPLYSVASRAMKRVKGYPAEQTASVLKQLFEDLVSTPQNVLEGIKDLEIVPTYLPSRQGPAVGLHTTGGSGKYVERPAGGTLQWEPPGAGVSVTAPKPPVKGRGAHPELYTRMMSRTPEKFTQTIGHEALYGHQLADTIRDYLGPKEYQKYLEIGKPLEGMYGKYNEQEATAHMLDNLSPGERMKVLSPFLEKLQIVETPIWRKTDIPSKKAMARHKEKTGQASEAAIYKRHVSEAPWKVKMEKGRPGREFPMTIEDEASFIHSGEPHPNQKVIDRLEKQIEGEKNPKYKQNFVEQLKAAREGKSKLIGLMNPLQEEGPLGALYGEKGPVQLDPKTTEAIKKLFRGE